MEGCKHSFLVLVGLCTAAAFQTSEVLPPPPPPFDELISLDADRFAHLNATEFSLALSGTPPSADGGVLVALPRSVALTAKALRNGVLAHFLEAPTLIKSMAKNRIPKIPDSFVFALWYLFQLHAGDKPHAEPLWQAWAERHHYTYTPPPREQALHRWSDEELEVLEEDRLTEAAVGYRKGVRDQYDHLLVPTAEKFPSFFPLELIGHDEFATAVAVGSAHNHTIDGIDGGALVPLTLRVHPQGNVRLEEVEQELLTPQGEVRSRRMIHLVPTGEGAAAFKPGEELTLATERHNDDLLLEYGYMWNEIHAAAVPIRMSLTDEASASAKLRGDLLLDANLNHTHDFHLLKGTLPPGLLLWCRIVHASDAELASAVRATDLERPLSEATETATYGALLRSLEGVLVRFEHGVDEDELKLAKSTLGLRGTIAVRNRRLSKLVLDDAMKRVGKLADAAIEGARKREKEEAAQKQLPSGDGTPDAPARGGGYSNAKARKREEEKRRKKEEEKRQRRERKAAKAAAEQQM